MHILTYNSGYTSELVTEVYHSKEKAIQSFKEWLSGCTQYSNLDLSKPIEEIVNTFLVDVEHDFEEDGEPVINDQEWDVTWDGAEVYERLWLVFDTVFNDEEL